MRAQEVETALERFFGDTTRSAAETFRGLLEIRSRLETMIRCLREEGVEPAPEERE